MSFDKYGTDESKKSLATLKKMFEKTKLDENFQRLGGMENGSGWSLNASLAYIQSLMEDCVYNKIIVANVQYCLQYAERTKDEASRQYFQQLLDEGYEFVSIDGNNTSSTIASFLNHREDLYYMNADGDKCTLRDLEEEEINDVIYNEKLDVAILREIGIEEMAVLFRRLNMSTKLNAQEHRQARWSDTAKFIREVSNLPEVRTLFENFVYQSARLDQRAHEETVAQFILKLLGYKSCHCPELDKFYENTDSLSDKLEHQVTANLGELSKMAAAQGPLNSYRMKRGQLQVLQDFVHDLTNVKKYRLIEHGEIFAWFHNKDNQFRQESKAIPDEDRREKSYLYWIDHPTVAPSWTKAVKKMLNAFEEEEEIWIENDWIVKKRTSADRFSKAQKEEALQLQGGKTRAGEDIGMKDLVSGDIHADHVVSVKEGGPTTLKNLELMKKAANLAKGARSFKPAFAFQEDREEE